MNAPLIIILPPGVDQRRLLRLIDEEVHRTMQTPAASTESVQPAEEGPLWTWFLPNPLPPAANGENET